MSDELLESSNLQVLISFLHSLSQLYIINVDEALVKKMINLINKRVD